MKTIACVLISLFITEVLFSQVKSEPLPSGTQVRKYISSTEPKQITSSDERLINLKKSKSRTPGKPLNLFYHHTFNDFKSGTFSDAGVNLYISKKGTLQFINIFDLNADGYPEVIVNNDHNHYETPNVFIYHNRMAKGLQSLLNPNSMDAPGYQNLTWTLESLKNMTQLPTEGGGKSVLCDVNGDGYKDLLFVNFIHGSTLLEIPAYIYWGGRDGFNSERRSLLPADRSTSLAVEDLNNDGLKDIVVSNSGREHLGIETPDFSHDALEKIAGVRENSSYVFYQTEAGFTIDNRQPIATSFAVDVKIADLDQNGSKELVFLELGAPGAIRIMELQDGKWRKKQLLSAIAPKPLPTGKRIYQELLIKDLNGDKFPDIFVPSAGDKSEIFWNNKGNFSQANRTVLETQNAMSADAGDLNNDGYTDLAIANLDSIGKDGKLNFECSSYIWWGSEKGFSKENRQALPTMGAVSVRIADVNNSGYPDLLFAQHRNQQTTDVPSYIYFNSKQGFYPENRLALQGYGAVNIIAEDLTGTGKKDVILINSLSGKAHHSGIEDGPGNEGVDPQGLPMYIYKGNNHKIYGTANLIRVPQSSAETNFSFADMEDDGKTDLVHLRGGGYRLVIRYDVYNYPSSNEISEFDIPFRANTVNVADFNKDGILDILATPITGPQGMIFFGTGNRHYKSELFNFPHYAYSCSIGDINNDGILDAVTSSHKEICILHGRLEHGQFHFNKPEIVTTEMLTTRVSMADFNNDGWLDILAENLQNTNTKIYDVESWVLINNNGKFSLKNKTSFHTYGANGGSIAQLKNDGKLNVVVSNYHADASRRVATFVLSEGNDGFPTEKDKIRLPSYSSGANLVLDFNGDGYQDILVFNHTGAEVYNGSLTPTGGVHGVGSVLYWGSENGFHLDNSSNVPSFGPHSRIMADPGSLARRKSYETFTSDYILNRSGNKNFNLIITGRFNQKQFVTPEILLGNKDEKSTSTILPVLQSASSDSVRYYVSIPEEKTFRYRLLMNSSNSGAGPEVYSVKMEEN